MDGSPELRASDADREHAAEVLRRAGGEGRLSVDELAGRLDQAFAARTRADLERLVADLPPDTAGSGAGPLPVVVGPGGTRWLLSIMSGHDRRGRWRVAPKMININFWGGTELDFNDAELAARDTEVRVITIMGGADIWVPEGLDVQVSHFSLMGGNRVELGSAAPVAGSPVLRLRLVTVCGGADVRRGRRQRRQDRRDDRRERRAQRRDDRSERRGRR
jgi:Domain of unknown function (DUF1707)/Cell wall-active antibiotics response 4TMS YvqF